MDVCVVLYHCDASRVEAGLRSSDRLLVVDNTEDNRGFSKGTNQAASMGKGALLCFVNPDGDLTSECLDGLERAFEDPEVVAAGPETTVPILDRPGRTVLSGCCMAVRRDAFESLGGFDERYFMYCEDCDLSLKLHTLGKVERVSVDFRHDSSPRSFIAEHRCFRNLLIVTKQHFGKADFSLVLQGTTGALRAKRWKRVLGKVTGITDYAVRAWRWA